MTSFLQTKLYRPDRGLDAIVRPRLLEQLSAGIEEGRLIAVLAPAGFGKTTLVACWLRDLLDSGAPFAPAWYSLDSRDNDPHLFMRYVAAAIRGAVPGSLSSVLAMLADATDRTTEQLTSALLRETAELTRDVVLVLDDYHVITHPEIHEIMRALVRYGPPRLHLVLTARHDPPIGIAALRARGGLTEVRAADLTFTPEETLQFLRASLGERVSAETAELLQNGTEGWAVGLRLASISLRDAPDINSFVDGFQQRSHRFVADYLVSEVIESRTEEEQQFLMMTSILRQLNRELCAAVVQSIDAIDAQALLERLESRGLFLIALDDRREWFRYHQQFGAILRGLLHRRLSRAEHDALHRRAAAWLSGNGYIEEAIEHLLAVGETAHAAALVSSRLTDICNGNRWDDLRRLLAQLPPETIAAAPDLLLGRAWLAAMDFDAPTANRLLTQLQALLPTADVGDAHRAFILAQMDALRGASIQFETPIQLRRILLRRSLSGLPRQATFVRGFVWTNLVRAIGDPAELPRIEALLRDEIAASPDQSSYRLLLHFLLALLHVRLGSLEDAEAHARRLLSLAEAEGALSAGAQAHGGLAFIAVCRNELEAALEHLEALTADPLVLGAEMILDMAFPAVTTLTAFGRLDRVRELIVVVNSFSDRGPVRHEAAALDALAGLLTGDPARALAWADANDAPPPRYFWERRAMVRALVRLVGGDESCLPAAAAELDAFLMMLEQAEDRTARILALVLRARLHWALGEREAALDKYELALALGYQRGFRRWYLGGRDIIEILSALAAAGRRVEEARALLRTLIGDVPPALPAGPLRESLSEREAQILSLLASRMSNKQIAAALGISPITVRNHTVNLYGKLLVNTRSEAVERGRELGLLVG